MIFVKIKSKSKLKKVNLFVPMPKDGVFIVTLGNGYKYEFSQKRKAEAFICDFSRLLTDRMYLVNELYSDLFSSYRRLWGFYHNDKESYSYKVYHEEKQIKESFTCIDLYLENLWLKSVNPQTNLQVFHDLKKSLRELINIDLILSKIVLNNPPETIKLNHLLRSLQFLENEINNYNIENASGVHENLIQTFNLKIAL